jgi:dihydrofolate synthase/folylpolyglutamate synthase
MTYEQAVEYLDSLVDFEKLGATYFGRDRFQLAGVRSLLTDLGNPQQTFKVVHIAGTKGKGSSAAMLDAILRAAGHAVGLFTKPHLVDIRERSRFGGRMIAETDFAAAVATVQPSPSTRHTLRRRSCTSKGSTLRLRSWRPASVAGSTRPMPSTRFCAP